MGGDRFLGGVFGVGEVDDSRRSVPAHTYRLRSIGDKRTQGADDFLVVHALAKKRGTDTAQIRVEIDRSKNTETTAAYAGKS